MKQLILLCFALALILGCTKTGPQGAPGAAGVVGPAGANGTIIYSGKGEPSATLGNVGDFYLDVMNLGLYGPKTADGWGTGYSLKGGQGDTGATGPQGATGATGPTGAAGSPGTKIYSGSGAPTVGLGIVGDFYLDTTSHDLWGPKLASGWGTGVSLESPPNVLYTAWVNMADPSAQAENIDLFYVETNYHIQALDSSIINTGAVFAFGNLAGYAAYEDPWPAGKIGQLPIVLQYTHYPVTTMITDTWSCVFSAGDADIIYSTDDANLTAMSNVQHNLFRFVLIRGGVNTSTPQAYIQ
ncbi:MAG TPA: hypothetical protein VGS79_01115 [Puia sp.]|nr:hypothetical protein [Puia sp.]